MLCEKYNLQSERTFETPCRAIWSYLVIVKFHFKMLKEQILFLFFLALEFRVFLDCFVSK